MSNRPDVVVVGTATTRVSPTSGAGEEEEEEGGVHALRTARPCYRRGEGEGRGVWRNSPDAICINEPPDNGARSMNYVPRDSNPNETRIIAFDSSLAPPLRAPRTPLGWPPLFLGVGGGVTVRRSAREKVVLENRRSPRFLSGFLFASGLSDGVVERSVWDF